MRALLTVAAVLALAPAARAEEVYKWSSETRSFSYAKSVCGGQGEGATTYTEEVTQEIFSRQSGVSHVGNGRTLPRGSSVSSGRIRRTLSKKVEMPDRTDHEDATITENMPLISANWGAVNRKGTGARRTIDVTGPDDPTAFSRLKKGESITVRINQTSPDVNEDDGRCVVTGHGNVTGTVTITRVR